MKILKATIEHIKIERSIEEKVFKWGQKYQFNNVEEILSSITFLFLVFLCLGINLEVLVHVRKLNRKRKGVSIDSESNMVFAVA